MKMRFFLALMISLPAFAGPQAADCNQTMPLSDHTSSLSAVARAVNASGQTCPDPSKLQNICNDVSLRSEEEDSNSTYTYKYERKIAEAACLDPNDSHEVVSRKVQAMWSSSQASLKCNVSDFDVSNGSILKYAIHTQTFGFINSAINKWRVNLNFVDESDRSTLLDYVRLEITRNQGTSLENTLKSYYDRLKAAGAKHSSEL